MRLIDGAEAIRGDLPSARTVEVPVPAGAGDAVGTGVNRLSSIAAVRDAVTEALGTLTADETPMIVGGDCGADLAGVARAIAQHPDVCVVWFDAHADLNSPETSPSRAFGGMVLRTLLGDGEDVLVPTPSLAPGRAVLVGTRDLDDAEIDFIDVAGVGRVTGSDPDSLVVAVAASGASSVYLHIDLDVLDPDAIAGVGAPVPFGLTRDEVVASIGSIRDRFPVVGAAITVFMPSSPAAADDDLSTILRVLSAVTSPRS
jgi:arginase